MLSPQGGAKVAMTDPLQPSSHSQVHITQLFEENTNKRPILTSQLNGQARSGLPLPDHHAVATESPHHGRQGSATSNKSMDSKPKSSFLSPEQAMKQFMSKLSTFEHHEVFNYPEGEFLFGLTGEEVATSESQTLKLLISSQCTLSVQMPRSGWG